MYINSKIIWHPKFLACGRDYNAAIGLWIGAICYMGSHRDDYDSAEQMLPKVVLSAIVPAVVSRRKTSQLAALLVKVGLWIDRGENWEIVGYGDLYFDVPEDE